MEHADHANTLFGDGGRRKENESTVLDSCQWNLPARDRWSYINQIIQIPDFHLLFQYTYNNTMNGTCDRNMHMVLLCFDLLLPYNQFYSDCPEAAFTGIV